MAMGGGEIEMKRVKLVAAVAAALMVAGAGAAGGSAAQGVTEHNGAAYLCPPAC
jgi:hypothetical protein